MYLAVNWYEWHNFTHDIICNRVLFCSRGSFISETALISSELTFKIDLWNGNLGIFFCTSSYSGRLSVFIETLTIIPWTPYDLGHRDMFHQNIRTVWKYEIQRVYSVWTKVCMQWSCYLGGSGTKTWWGIVSNMKYLKFGNGNADCKDQICPIKHH